MNHTKLELLIPMHREIPQEQKMIWSLGPGEILCMLLMYSVGILSLNILFYFCIYKTCPP